MSASSRYFPFLILSSDFPYDTQSMTPSPIRFVEGQFRGPCRLGQMDRHARCCPEGVAQIGRKSWSLELKAGAGAGVRPVVTGFWDGSSVFGRLKLLQKYATRPIYAAKELEV